MKAGALRSLSRWHRFSGPTTQINCRERTVPSSIFHHFFHQNQNPPSLILSLWHKEEEPISVLHLKSSSMDEQPSFSEDENINHIVESSNGQEIATTEASSEMEPFVGMEFESEEAAKVFYDAYATQLGFIMRVDAFRRSMRDGKVVWRRLVCNKEGFRKLRPRRNENRKPRAVTREGCKAMIVVKKEKTGKWVVTKFVKDHNHPLVAIPANGRRSILLSQTPDEKDIKIRELTAELQRERKRSAAFQEQLDKVLRDMEEHSNHLSRNIDDIVQSVREIESKR